MKRRTRLEMFEAFLIDFRNHGDDKRHSKRLFEGIKKYAPELTQWILQHSLSMNLAGQIQKDVTLLFHKKTARLNIEIELQQAHQQNI